MKYFLSVILAFLSLSLSAQDFSSICLDKTEKDIITLINQYRAENKLPELKLSASLCYVADVHAKDLYLNKPHEGCGSMNSWSNKGRWKKLCYNKSKTALRDMKNKPAELTQYKGQSIELVYFCSDDYTATDVLNDWKSYPPSNNLILNKQPYAATKWTTIGAGFFEGYLCVWFGPIEDKFTEVNDCIKEIITQVEEIIVQEVVVENFKKTDDEFEDFDRILEEENTEVIVNKEIIKPIEATKQNEIIQEEVIIVESKTNNTSEIWYVIVGVASDKSSADNEVLKIRNAGYPNAVAIFDKDAKYNFRIAADKFNNREEAEILKNELVKKGYKDAWLLKK